MAPPSAESPSRVCNILSVVEGLFMGFSLVVLAASPIVTSYSSIRIRIEHVSFQYIGPCSDMIFFYQ